VTAGKPLRAIGTNTGYIFASQTISSLLRAVYAAVLARELGPELFGLMNYGLGWYAAFLAVANLQLESYMSRELALDRSESAAVLSRSMTLRVFSTAIVFACALASVLVSGEDDLLATVLLILAIAIVGRSAAMWCNSAFVSRESAGHVFSMEVAFRIIEVLVGITALLLGYGLLAIALLHSLSWLAQAVYGFWLVRRHLAQVRFQPRLSEQLTLFRAVLPMAVSSIAATWLMQGPFVLYVAQVSAGTDAGVVALVLQLFVLATGIPVALGRAALPALSRTVARADNREELFLGLVMRAGIAGTAALVIGGASAGAWLIAPVFGESYRPAGQYVALGMLLVLPFGLASITNQILLAHGRNWQAMASAVLGAAVMSVLICAFMPADGAISRYFLYILAGMLAWSIAGLALLGRVIRVEWTRCLLSPALAGGLGIGMYYGLAAAIGIWTSGIVAMIVLLAALRIFNVVDRNEAAALARFIGTGRNRN
jgi:O-antigen/teichoic acid export membrane protein